MSQRAAHAVCLGTGACLDNIDSCTKSHPQLNLSELSRSAPPALGRTWRFFRRSGCRRFRGLVLLTTFFMIGDQRAARGERVDAPCRCRPDRARRPFSAVRWPFERIRGLGEYVALIDVERENETLARSARPARGREPPAARALARAQSRAHRGDASRFEADLMPARVIGQDVSPYFRSLLLDRGRRSGVLSGMPVVSDHGLVGLSPRRPRARRARCCSSIAALRRRRDAAQPRARHRARTGTDSLDFSF